jgi:hypothetical protein
MAYSIGMIKIKDVVVDRLGRIFQVEGFKGDLVLARLYRSQKRFALPSDSIRKHPFFS